MLPNLIDFSYIALMSALALDFFKFAFPGFVMHLAL